ncbi:LysE family transporter [Planomicrobium sp. Y74]|uniref:LysE family translocator n=1 Tax=Planomicrobium sp. Y74 TaxID=2478977 RepID=UPI000EF557C5|nr:LysE family transporter [Planomicrobium sp. Y74]RLQ90967.1 lysine transporter LysE [Planomicrobium sp. Y74]
MASNLMSYILLGFSLSVPVGAITVEMIKRGLLNGFWHAWLVGVGGMSADVVLMLLIYFGVANLLTGSAAQITIWLCGFVVLVYLGIGSIREAFRKIELGPGRESRSDSLAKAYLAGFAIAISNPLNIIFWISIYGSVLATTLQKVNGGKILFYSSAIFIGIAIWDLVIAGSVHFGRGFAGERFMKWFSIAAGLVLIGFGVSFGWQAAAKLLSLMIYGN